MKRFTILAIFMLLAAGASWAVFEFVVWNKVPRELVGKWVVTGGEQDGAAFDFYHNGRMVGNVNVRGREGRVDARVSIEGDRLLIVTRNPHTGEDEARSQRIHTLTTTHLVLVEAGGGMLRLERAE